MPHPGDLTHVEGTLTVASGKQIHAGYDHDAAGDFSMQVDSSTNSGSIRRHRGADVGPEPHGDD